jgi:iron complex outermembrane receptor protein
MTETTVLKAVLFYGANLFKSPGDHDVVSDKKIDGNTFDFSGNLGTKIGNKGGFGNFTLELINKDYSIRNANPEKHVL